MPQPSQHLPVLPQPQFAARVPQLAQRSLISICGCLAGLAAEVSITPLLATADACYLITPAFAIAIADPAQADEYGTPLFQPVAVEQVAALLNSGFTTLWTPIAPTGDTDRAIVQHAAARTGAASAALAHALRGNGGDAVGAILPVLARIAADLAVAIRVLALQAADNTDTATERAATLLSTLLAHMAEQFEHLPRVR